MRPQPPSQVVAEPFRDDAIHLDLEVGAVMERDAVDSRPVDNLNPGNQGHNPNLRGGPAHIDGTRQDIQADQVVIACFGHSDRSVHVV